MLDARNACDLKLTHFFKKIPVEFIFAQFLKLFKL